MAASAGFEIESEDDRATSVIATEETGVERAPKERENAIQRMTIVLALRVGDKEEARV